MTEEGINIQQNRMPLQWYTVRISGLCAIHIYHTPLRDWSYQIDSIGNPWGHKFSTKETALSSAIDVVRGMLFYADAQIKDYDSGNKDFPEWKW